MDEYNVVRVIKLVTPDRQFDGTVGVKRPPRVRDLGTIVHVLSPGKEFIVECVNSEGDTVWLAQFNVEELEEYQASAQVNR